MSEDRKAKAAEQVKAIEEKLESLKLDVIDAGYKLAQTGDDLYLRSVQQKREMIEALEYALSHKPRTAAVFGLQGR